MSASTYGFNGNNPFVSIYSVDNNGNLQSPAETRPVSLNGAGPFTVNCPATFTNDLDVSKLNCDGSLMCFGDAGFNNSVTISGPVSCNNNLTIANGKSLRLADITNTFVSEVFTDNNTGSIMFTSSDSINGDTLPEPTAYAGMSIAWNINNGEGTTDLINYSQAGGGLGFNLRAINAFSPCITVASFKANKLPTFTYGPVCYGSIPAAWDQSKALILPYFITGGFQIANTSTGVYQVNFPSNLTNVTCQVTLGTVEGGYMMGCCVQLQTVPNQLTINTFQIIDANNTATKPESLPFNLTINAGLLTI